MSEVIVFAERAIAPGGDLIWPAALEHLARRFASIRELDVTAIPAREDAVPALEAWAGEDVSSWRLELGRFYDDHARVHLRRDPSTAALLGALRARGVKLAVYGQGPRETSAITLAFLGLDRRPGRGRARACRRWLRSLSGGPRRRRRPPRQLARGARRDQVSRARRSASSSPVRAIAST